MNKRPRWLVAFVFTAVFGAVPIDGLAQQAAGAHVGGVVVSAGDRRPLPHAKVILQTLQTLETVSESVSGPDGRFVFLSAPEGKFRLVGFASGYVSTAYQGHDGFSTAVVIGGNVRTDDLQLELTPASSISGRLTDEAGDPIATGQIMLYREAFLGAKRVYLETQVQTSATGEYEFENLIPGRYFLAATASPWYEMHPPAETSTRGLFHIAVDPRLDVVYPMLFYPSALDSGGASAITVHGGEKVSAPMQMLPVRALTVTVHSFPKDPKTRESFSVLQLTRTVFGEEEVLSQAIGTNSDGEQQPIVLAPGQYHIREIDPRTNRLSSSAEPIQLATDSISMDISPAQRSTVRASVHNVDGGPAPKGLLLELSVNDLFPAAEHVDDHGMVTWNDIPEGVYRVKADLNGRPITVLQIKRKEHIEADRRLHVDSDGETVNVDVIVVPNTTTVEGFAKRDGNPAPGSMLLLMSAAPVIDEELVRRDQSDLAGSFLFRDVAPGNYLLVAIDDGWPLQITDPAVMQRYLLHAVPVIVPATSSKPIHLSEPVVAQQR